MKGIGLKQRGRRMGDKRNLSAEQEEEIKHLITIKNTGTAAIRVRLVDARKPSGS